MGATPAHRREMFAARLQRWWPDLIDGLSEVYDDPHTVASAAVVAAAEAFAAREDDLHALDLRRMLEPDWFQRPNMLGYAAYADRFAGSLSGVAARAPYLCDLGVTYLHLMPVLRARTPPNDGGYAVADYLAVDPTLGTIDDLRDLARRLRGDGISLCLDLVLNHVADEHEWVTRARAGETRYRDYFYTYPDRGQPDAFERTLPEVFPAFAPGSFTWDAALGAHVWTTFNSYQWDVNWSNPDVFGEYVNIVLQLANLGVEVLRLDAIAFLWKQLGTNCQNQPEVHALTQALRAVAKIACPAVVFQAEAIVAPHDLVHYLGTGKHHAKVSDLAYHNSLMVQMWSMLATRDVRLASLALASLPAIPPSCAWLTYLRCHDDIGWAIDDADAAAVGLSGPAHRAFLSDFYSGRFPGSFASGLVFQLNEATGDRRISGSTASLVGLGREDPSAVSRILLAHAVVLGWGGLPVLWMGDELGLLNDEEWDREPGHEDDNRWVHRPRMPWGEAVRRWTPGSSGEVYDGRGGEVTAGRGGEVTAGRGGEVTAGRGAEVTAGRGGEVTAGRGAEVYDGMRRLIAARAALPHLHASIPARVLPPSDPGVLLVLREHPLGPMIGAYNVTEEHRPLPASRVSASGLDPHACVDHISGGRVEVNEDTIWLAPYSALWLTEADD